MTTELALITEDGFSREKIDLIKRTIAIDCNSDELQLFLYTCKRTGLDPLARQIYAIKRGGKMTIQTGIDGYRVIADRTGKLAGISDYIFDSEDERFPAKATVTVRKMVDGVNIADFTATARWGEYNAGGPMWGKMPYLMLGKCAEALALRKAFPADLSGVYTAEEMAQVDNPERDQVFAEVERQKSNVGRLPQEGVDPISKYAPDSIPPELEWSWNKASGVLICRIVKAEKKAKADGSEYVVLTVNNRLDAGRPAGVYYWHATHREQLLGAVGKIVKLIINEKAKGFTVEAVMEIDGQKVGLKTPVTTGTKPFESLETQARLLASTLDMRENDFQWMVKEHKGDWPSILEQLKQFKAQKEQEQSA